MKRYNRWKASVQNERQRKTVQTFIGIRSIHAHRVERLDGETLLVFLLEPDNLSVLSEDSLHRKIYGFMTVLKGVADLEFCCVNARERYTENKQYLKKRLREEINPKVRALLADDLAVLETMEQRNLGAREFLVLLRFQEETSQDWASVLSRVEKAFQEQAIRVRRAEEADLKRILSVYFGWDLPEERMEDFDGERWVMASEAKEAAVSE